MERSIIIIPTYNESENITRLISEIFEQQPLAHILIIDDNSPDGTSTIVNSLIAKFSTQLFLVQREGKLGLGTAYILGFKWALNHGYEYIFEMDADFSHPVISLQKLYEACAVKKFDVAVGSRYIKGGKVINWPANRVLMSYYASVYVRLITWMPVQDTTAGFVCYRRKVLETIDLNKVTFVGYAFQIEMKYAAYCLGFNIKEVPIIFTDRVDGTSKMSKGIFNEAVFGVIKMRWNSFFHSYKMQKVTA